MNKALFIHHTVRCYEYNGEQNDKYSPHSNGIYNHGFHLVKESEQCKGSKDGSHDSHCQYTLVLRLSSQLVLSLLNAQLHKIANKMLE